MLDVVPWRPACAVAWDALQAVLRWVPGIRRLSSLSPRQPWGAAGVPVYVMLPLDAALPASPVPDTALRKLAAAGAAGVMADVWWGLCERTAGRYDFAEYIALFRRCRGAGLFVQATLSFHACGGNVGDSVNIPLPEWVVAAGDKHGFWFTDRSGAVNHEYISFGADHEPLLPGFPGAKLVSPVAGAEEIDEYGEAVASPGRRASGSKVDVRPRTPLQAYGAFVKAFVDAMRAEGLMGTTIRELQVGLGPSGELRYPSYPLTDGKWQFPGIGEFQCFDKFLLKDLEENVREHGSEAVKRAKLPPEGTGTYNDSPRDTEFFRSGFRSEAGAFFLQWYSSRMLEHGEDVLRQVRSVVPVSDSSVTLAVKISGVHWWKFSASRAAEATSGYIMSGRCTAYRDIAKLLRTAGAVLDFTCLEMRTVDQPFLRARCGPRQLVAEVFRAARKEGVAVSGENALERYDWGAYAQVISAFRRCGARRYGFTLLRLGETLLEEENMETFERFVQAMRRLE